MLDKQKQMPTFCLKYVSKMKVRKVKRHRLCAVSVGDLYEYTSFTVCSGVTAAVAAYHSTSISADANNVHHLSLAFASSNFEM